MDKERGLALWGRLRISNYINISLILILFALSKHYVTFTENGELVFALALFLSHLNYHYQLAKVANFFRKNCYWKNSGWWYASFFTFPIGPLCSYLLIKPVAVRFLLPV